MRLNRHPPKRPPPDADSVARGAADGAARVKRDTREPEGVKVDELIEMLSGEFAIDGFAKDVPSRSSFGVSDHAIDCREVERLIADHGAGHTGRADVDAA